MANQKRTRLLIFSLILLIAGCQHDIHLTGDFPDPLIEKKANHIGLFLDQETTKQKFSQESLSGRLWIVHAGRANNIFLEKLFRSMFKEVSLVESYATTNSDIEFIASPSLQNYALVTPDDSGNQFFSVSLEYVVDFFEPSGNKITSVKYYGYGKQSSKQSSETAVKLATTEALRQAGARIIFDLEQRNVVQPTK